MKFVRIVQKSGEPAYGLLREDGQVAVLDGNPFTGFRETGQTLALSELKLLAPCLPSKIVAIGVNYRDHAAEFSKEIPKEPLIFLKPPSAVVGSGDPIIHPDVSKRVDFEAELAVVIGRRAWRVPPERANHYIRGYTCINDVTARDLQKSDGQWSRAKGFDTFAPLGPCIATDLDPNNLAVKSFLNNEPRQSSNTSKMIFPIDQLLSHISHVMTLLPGDIIATGTPAGVGPMKAGDTVTVEVEGIGQLTNTVQSS